jgi:hypothetical protein
MYTGNLSIVEDGAKIGRLVFIFSVDCPKEEIPKAILFEIQIPGMDDSFVNDIPVSPPAFEEKHTRWVVRHAMAVQNITARSGKIVASVKLDGDELEMSSPLIVVEPPTFWGAPIDPGLPDAQSPPAPQE